VLGLETSSRPTVSGALLDSDFREKAKRVLRKFNDGFEHGGSFISWTDEDREIWGQINALDPLEAHDLSVQALKSRMDDWLREIDPGIKGRLHVPTPNFTEGMGWASRFIEWAENLSEADRREMGSTPEGRYRWLLKKLFPPTSS
jgi:hypothetical protein